MDISVIEDRKARASIWFERLRDDICSTLEQLEDDAPASLYAGRAGRFARGDKRTSAEGQEWSSSLVRQGVSTVRKAMYEGDQTGRKNGSPPPNTMTKEGFAVRLGLAHSQALGHFVVEEAFAGHIRLHPLAIDHKLRNGAFTGAFNDFIHRSRSGFDIDFFVRDVVLGQEALGLAAIRTPCRRINS